MIKTKGLSLKSQEILQDHSKKVNIILVDIKLS